VGLFAIKVRLVLDRVLTIDVSNFQELTIAIEVLSHRPSLLNLPEKYLPLRVESENSLTARTAILPGLDSLELLVANGTSKYSRIDGVLCIELRFEVSDSIFSILAKEEELFEAEDLENVHDSWTNPDHSHVTIQSPK